MDRALLHLKVPESGYTRVTEPGCTILPGPCSTKISDPGYIDVPEKIYSKLPGASLTMDNPGPLQWTTK